MHRKLIDTLELIINSSFAFNKWKLSQASVAALDFVACQSKKAANIHNRW